MKNLAAKNFGYKVALCLLIFLSCGLSSFFLLRPAHAGCAPLPADRGSASFSVSLPNAGTYRSWSRIYAPNNTDDSYYLQVDNSHCGIVVDDSTNTPAKSLSWVDYQDG